jgi:hypothetical protein
VIRSAIRASHSPKRLAHTAVIVNPYSHLLHRHYRLPLRDDLLYACLELAMADPWDAPPFPKYGNKSSRILYESIGRALSTWEELECFLASLYAALCGKDRAETEANNKYGKMNNFKDRLGELNRAGCRYFVNRPNQNLEGEFATIIKFTKGYSARRNDVAHGIVRMIHMTRDPSAGMLSFRGPPQWCLIPPHFREAKYISPSIPAHVLTSREINGFSRAFWPIIRRTHALTNQIEFPQHALRRKRAVPPLLQS